ncbi:MAG: hypothetical protein U9Q15_00905 [Patescibacteria group bacterium]|nr:hypothetical protein [Patescibacteria group bacterium]
MDFRNNYISLKHSKSSYEVDIFEQVYQSKKDQAVQNFSLKDLRWLIDILDKEEILSLIDNIPEQRLAEIYLYNILKAYRLPVFEVGGANYTLHFRDCYHDGVSNYYTYRDANNTGYTKLSDYLAILRVIAQKISYETATVTWDYDDSDIFVGWIQSVYHLENKASIKLFVDKMFREYEETLYEHYFQPLQDSKNKKLSSVYNYIQEEYFGNTMEKTQKDFHNEFFAGAAS